MTCSYEQFKKDITKHKLNILLDNGLYRHLLIKEAGNIEYFYEITTWPGYLCISGDMGCFVFKRTEDMFTFFRKQPGCINPGYWQEKVQAGTGFDGALAITSEPDLEAYDDRLDDYLKDFIDSLDPNNEEDDEKAEAAQEAVDDFKNWRDGEHDAVARINNWDPEAAGGLKLDDFWDGHRGLTKFKFHYIWCCYAIVHAIALYDAAKSGEVAA